MNLVGCSNCIPHKATCRMEIRTEIYLKILLNRSLASLVISLSEKCASEVL